MPAYLLAVILTFLVWLYLFLISKGTRREMVITGTLLTPFVILDIFTVPSYWKPVTLMNVPVGAEGFLFTFFITGIAAVIYEVVFKKRFSGKKIHLIFCLSFITPAAIAMISVYILHLNIIYFFILGFTLMALAELIQRRDLLTDAVASSVLFGAVYFLVFSLWIYLEPESINWWNFTKLSNIRLGYVPLEEILFSISMGFFAGPLYEYLTSGHVFRSGKRKLAKVYRRKN